MNERQAKLVSAKAEYRKALRNLESISEEIHAQRRSLAMGTREQGVGAEGDEGDGHDDVANFKMESDGLSSEYLRRGLLVRSICRRCSFVCASACLMSLSVFQ